MYFLVNASPKLLDVATSSPGELVMWRILGNILCNHGPKVKVKVKSEKAGIRNGVSWTAVLC